MPHYGCLHPLTELSLASLYVTLLDQRNTASNSFPNFPLIICSTYIAALYSLAWLMSGMNFAYKLPTLMYGEVRISIQAIIKNFLTCVSYFKKNSKNTHKSLKSQPTWILWKLLGIGTYTTFNYLEFQFLIEFSPWKSKVNVNLLILWILPVSKRDKNWITMFWSSFERLSRLLLKPKTC